MILLPEKIHDVAELFGPVVIRKEVGDFVLSI
jgi:hypothetical protein